MTVVVALVLAALAFVVVAYPLFRQRPGPTDSVEDEQLLELHYKRDAIYSAIAELEFDFKSGTLSAEDYRDLEASYKRKAISILRNIDDLEKGTQKGTEKGTELEDAIEKQVMRLRQADVSTGGVCPECGAKYLEEGRFCPHCGTKL